VAAIASEGSVEVFEPGGTVTSNLGTVPAGTPPLVVPGLEEVVLVVPPGAAPMSAPALMSSGWLASIGDDGDLMVAGPEGVARYPVDAMRDGRIAVASDGRLLVLVGPTDRYDHAVLGDAVEAAGFAVVEPGSGARATVTLEAPAVFEAVVPMWADLDGNGIEEIVVTVSDSGQGARIAVYDASGEVVAEGPPIGRGFRWRQLIAAGPFGPDGETEIAVVRTPHIGGVLEMYRLEGDGLVIAATLAGPFGSHRLGSRNLDMAMAGDFDGDGRVEVVLPSADRRTVVGVAHTSAGLETVWSTALPAPLTSNLGAVDGPDGLVLVAGLEDGSVTVWSP
jgi:hypothetical protein